MLEARTALTAARRRSRQASKLRQRYLLLTDSQVVASILGKGKTSSRKVLPVVKKFNALNLASHCVALVGYIPSSENPADVPSRWPRVKSKLRPSQRAPVGGRRKGR